VTEPTLGAGGRYRGPALSGGPGDGSPGAVPAALRDALVGDLDAGFDEMVDLRHDLHAHPELSLAETRTTALIADHMAGLGVGAIPAGTATGGAYVLDGGRPGSTVVLRADIDALPVDEAVDLPYRSVVPGSMHACGHDLHTATLLGVARALAGRSEDLPGRYVFVFQPAEEALCGATSMIEGGLLDAVGPARLVGFHVASILPAGFVALRPGISMSEAHSIRIEVRGRGGHGALPGIGGNVIVALAELVRGLPDVVEGLHYEGVPCVCGAGMVRAGTAVNIVPDHALVAGTLRTFTAPQRAEALAALAALCDRVAADEGVTIELVVAEHVDAVENDPSVTAVVEQVARTVAGSDQVFIQPPVSPSDDVSAFLRLMPGCYFFVGGGRPDGSSGMHHSPTFSVEDGAMRTAGPVLAASAVALAGGAATTPE
jgi:amidohydrolase